MILVDLYTVQRAGMSAVCLILAQLAVQFADANVRIAAMVVSDPRQLLFSVGAVMLTVRAVRLVFEWIPSCRHTAYSSA